MSACVCVCERECANEFYKRACFSGLEEVCMCVCVFFLSLECVHSVEGLIYASSTVCTCPSVE